MRLAQLKTNLVRLRALSGNLGARYVMCNIPAAQHRGDRERRRGLAPHRGGRQAGPAVAGDQQQDRRDQLQSVLDRAGLDRAQDLIPKMQAEPDYLTNNHIRIFDSAAERARAVADQLVLRTRRSNYRFKQDPGDFNSLGSMRINFPSPYGVYMHDTPLKNLFGEDYPLPFVGLRARAERARARRTGC